MDDIITENEENFFTNLELLDTDIDIVTHPAQAEIMIQDFGDGENSVEFVLLYHCFNAPVFCDCIILCSAKVNHSVV